MPPTSTKVIRYTYVYVFIMVDNRFFSKLHRSQFYFIFFFHQDNKLSNWKKLLKSITFLIEYFSIHSLFVCERNSFFLCKKYLSNTVNIILLRSFFVYKCYIKVMQFVIETYFSNLIKTGLIFILAVIVDNRVPSSFRMQRKIPAKNVLVLIQSPPRALFFF